jgi:hypothetical protein
MKLFFWRNRRRQEFRQQQREKLSQALNRANHGNVREDDFDLLIEATRWDAETAQRVEDLLVRLLPKLDSMVLENLPRSLNKKVRAYLYRYLRIDTSNQALSLAVVEAMQKFADSEAEKYVSELTLQKPQTHSQEELVRKACECLTSVQERAHQHRLSETLLHPTSAPQASFLEDNLLHPSYPPNVPANARRQGPGAE